MSNTSQHTRAAEVVEAVERAGIVAVIRMKDPNKLQAVVDAIAEGGIRALEITMTVPGAVEHALELPASFGEELAASLHADLAGVGQGDDQTQDGQPVGSADVAGHAGGVGAQVPVEAARVRDG